MSDLLDRIAALREHVSVLDPFDSRRVVVRGLLNQAETLLKQVKQAERLVERAEREVRQ